MFVKEQLPAVVVVAAAVVVAVVSSVVVVLRFIQIYISNVPTFSPITIANNYCYYFSVFSDFSPGEMHPSPSSPHRLRQQVTTLTAVAWPMGPSGWRHFDDRTCRWASHKRTSSARVTL